MEKTEFGIDCVQCGHEFTMMANEMDVANWREGSVFIQDAMPYLSDGERELFISGTCGACFDKMFPPDSENDD